MMRRMLSLPKSRLSGNVDRGIMAIKERGRSDDADLPAGAGQVVGGDVGFRYKM